MSYNGTVYCGHCGEKGHNRRGCPKLKEQMTRRLADNPDDYWAKSYFKKKEGSKVRTCSFCGEEGHNKATCPKKKEAVAQFKKANRHYQEQVAKVFEERGIKVGALVVHPQLWIKGEYVDNVVGVITDIDWDKIHIWNQGNDAPRCLNVRFTGATSQTAIVSPKLLTEAATLDWDTYSSYCVPVVSPGSGSIGDRRADGLLSKPAMKNLLEDDKWENRYDYDTREYRPTTEMEMKCEKYWTKLNEKKENK